MDLLRHGGMFGYSYWLHCETPCQSLFFRVKETDNVETPESRPEVRTPCIYGAINEAEGRLREKIVLGIRR
jgi:hypothetical protein